jgi:hypothetical protein
MVGGKKILEKKERNQKMPRKPKKAGKSSKGERRSDEVSKTKAIIFLVVAFGMAVVFLFDIFHSGGTVKGFFAAVFALVCGFFGAVYLKERKGPSAR